MLSARPISLNADGPAYGAIKTPGRALNKSRSALQENAGHRGALTATTKGKKVALQQTPFHPDSLKPQKLFTLKDGPATTSKPSSTVSRPLLDKTPFPNRVAPTQNTPHPNGTQKISKLSLLEAPTAQTPNLLPSSTRKSIRVPRLSGSGGKLRDGGIGIVRFQTPQTNGNHWDVSDGDIDVGESEAQLQLQEVAEEEKEDYDEVEYMPPTAIIPAYQPPFELPDYKVLGRSILALTHSYPVDDYTPPEIEVPSTNDEFVERYGGGKWESFDLPELVDDNPFALPKPTTRTVPNGKLPAARTGARPANSIGMTGRTANARPSTVTTAVQKNATIRLNTTTPASRSAVANSRATVGATSKLSNAVPRMDNEKATAGPSKATIGSKVAARPSTVPLKTANGSGATAPTTKLSCPVVSASKTTPPTVATTTRRPALTSTRPVAAGRRPVPVASALQKKGSGKDVKDGGEDDGDIVLMPVVGLDGLEDDFRFEV